MQEKYRLTTLPNCGYILFLCCYLNKKDISKKKEIKILKGKPDIKGIKE